MDSHMSVGHSVLPVDRAAEAAAPTAAADLDTVQQSLDRLQASVVGIRAAVQDLGIVFAQGYSFGGVSPF
jgi:hypothetical protein